MENVRIVVCVFYVIVVFIVVDDAGVLVFLEIVADVHLYHVHHFVVSYAF